MFDPESETGLSSIMEVLDASSDEGRLHVSADPARHPAVDDVFSFAHAGTHNFCDGPPYLRCNAPHGAMLLSKLNDILPRESELSVWVEWGDCWASVQDWNSRCTDWVPKCDWTE